MKTLSKSFQLARGVQWDRVKLGKLKRAHKQRADKEPFMFEGKEMQYSYASSLINYLESVLNAN